MAAPDQRLKANRPGANQFTTTHWSLVVAAGAEASPIAVEALEKLCRTYWYPLYAYVRRQGHAADEAQDLTQGFFARLLEKDYISRANRNRRPVPLLLADRTQSLSGG